MTLYTKCILNPASSEEGVRISVMSRHTLNDGKTPDTRLNDQYLEHLQKLGPPAKLIGDYYKRGLKWEEFEKRYLDYLQNPEIKNLIEDLARRALVKDLTLLCIEETPERCHRRLIAEECQRLMPELKVEHR